MIGDGFKGLKKKNFSKHPCILQFFFFVIRSLRAIKSMLFNFLTFEFI